MYRGAWAARAHYEGGLRGRLPEYIYGVKTALHPDAFVWCEDVGKARQVAETLSIKEGRAVIHARHRGVTFAQEGWEGGVYADHLGAWDKVEVWLKAQAHRAKLHAPKRQYLKSHKYATKRLWPAGS